MTGGSIFLEDSAKTSLVGHYLLSLRTRTISFSFFALLICIYFSSLVVMPFSFGTEYLNIISLLSENTAFGMACVCF